MEGYLRELTATCVRIADIVTDPGLRTYWPYLLVTLAIAVAATLRLETSLDDKPGIAGALRKIFDRKIWLHESAVVDYLCYTINAILGIVSRATLVAIGAAASGVFYNVLLAFNGGLPLDVKAENMALIAAGFLVLLWMDFSFFLAHYLSHRWNSLWEFHKIHHSAQVLTPVTTFRHHPVDRLFNYLLAGIFFGIAGAITLFVFGKQVQTATVLGAPVGVFIFYLLGANLRHSQIWLPYPRWLSYVLISPAQHQIHHSNLVHHYDRNFGRIFAFWDWVFGTLYVPDRREPLTFGLSNREDAEYQSIDALYLLPFKKIWRRLTSPKRTS